MMSGADRSNRKSTDFTIARILSDDLTDDATLQDINLHKSSDSVDTLLHSRNYDHSKVNYHHLPNDIGTRDSEIFKNTHKFIQNEIINSTSTNKSFRDDEGSKKKINLSSLSSTESSNELYWLQCTRYRPPKLPRKSFVDKVSKRRSATHPRIPFTSYQLHVLEDKYKSSAYLSRKDVVQLSTTLRIPNSRIKIWFQNRRARDRRETKVTTSLPMDCKDKI